MDLQVMPVNYDSSVTTAPQMTTFTAENGSDGLGGESSVSNLDMAKSRTEVTYELLLQESTPSATYLQTVSDAVQTVLKYNLDTIGMPLYDYKINSNLVQESYPTMAEVDGSAICMQAIGTTDNCHTITATVAFVHDSSVDKGLLEYNLFSLVGFMVHEVQLRAEPQSALNIGFQAVDTDLDLVLKSVPSDRLMNSNQLSLVSKSASDMIGISMSKQVSTDDTDVLSYRIDSQSNQASDYVLARLRGRRSLRALQSNDSLLVNGAVLGKQRATSTNSFEALVSAASPIFNTPIFTNQLKYSLGVPTSSNQGNTDLDSYGYFANVNQVTVKVGNIPLVTASPAPEAPAELSETEVDNTDTTSYIPPPPTDSSTNSSPETEPQVSQPETPTNTDSTTIKSANATSDLAVASQKGIDPMVWAGVSVGVVLLLLVVGIFFYIKRRRSSSIQEDFKEDMAPDVPPARMPPPSVEKPSSAVAKAGKGEGKKRSSNKANRRNSCEETERSESEYDFDYPLPYAQKPPPKAAPSGAAPVLQGGIGRPAPNRKPRAAPPAPKRASAKRAPHSIDEEIEDSSYSMAFTNNREVFRR